VEIAAVVRVEAVREGVVIVGIAVDKAHAVIIAPRGQETIRVRVTELVLRVILLKTGTAVSNLVQETAIATVVPSPRIRSSSNTIIFSNSI
jgi:hypothetical protein